MQPFRSLRDKPLAACIVAIAAGVFFALFVQPARAGIGPENVLVVVNRNSPASRTIANHYIRLRDIPPGNVLSLPWDPAVQTTDVETFRQEILEPINRAIQSRRLAAQIDCVAYSSDFPTAIRLDKDVPEALAELKRLALAQGAPASTEPAWPTPYTKVGSINGLTYLGQAVMARQALAYCDLKSNFYFSQGTSLLVGPESRGFRSRYQYGSRGERVDSGGRQYVLSTMLGVTAGRGNSPTEVLDSLARSAAADGTQPRGTIYYVENDDVRSRVRHNEYPAAVRLLKQLGVEAEVLSGKVPMDKSDVQGAMLGTANFNWKSSGSTVLPGAICEHFTSFGGMMGADAGQTPLSELLRYGAAGASGTVAEPYALAEKFPSPMIHVHYARGCTLAEAFYQSVSGPYQLLIVGDPLCRPWAKIPQVAVEVPAADVPVEGELVLRPTATIAGDSAIDRFELFVDGWRRAACRPGEPLRLDTRLLADGHHELRVVAVEVAPIESQGGRAFSITTANHGRTITASVSPEGTVRPGAPLVVSAESPGSTSIAVLHGSRLLGQIAGERGQLPIDPAKLGFGPVSLRVVGLGEGDPTSYAWARPIALTIEGEP